MACINARVGVVFGWEYGWIESAAQNETTNVPLPN